MYRNKNTVYPNVHEIAVDNQLHNCITGVFSIKFVNVKNMLAQSLQYNTTRLTVCSYYNLVKVCGPDDFALLARSGPQAVGCGPLTYKKKMICSNVF